MEKNSFKKHDSASLILQESPSMSMLASLVRRMCAFACRKNEFMLSQMKGFGLGDETGPAEECKKTKCVQWFCQIGLGTLFAIHCKLL